MSDLEEPVRRNAGKHYLSYSVLIENSQTRKKSSVSMQLKQIELKRLQALKAIVQKAVEAKAAEMEEAFDIESKIINIKASIEVEKILQNSSKEEKATSKPRRLLGRTVDNAKSIEVQEDTYCMAASNEKSGVELAWKNYASPDCGAKVVAAKPEAVTPIPVISSSHEKYKYASPDCGDKVVDSKPESVMAVNPSSMMYASHDCGAKVVTADPETVSPSSAISPSPEEYIVELCEGMANTELFSPNAKEFTAHMGDPLDPEKTESVLNNPTDELMLNFTTPHVIETPKVTCSMIREYESQKRMRTSERNVFFLSQHQEETGWKNGEQVEEMQTLEKTKESSSELKESVDRSIVIVRPPGGLSPADENAPRIFIYLLRPWMSFKYFFILVYF